MKRLARASIGFCVLASAISLSLAFAASAKDKQKAKLLFVDNDSNSAQAKTGLIIVTHGWIEKGRGDWPEDMAIAINNRIDANNWLCGYFDWSEGAKTINPADAAKYAEDFVGTELARQIVKKSNDFRHVHLIGHSSGCWVINEAAKIIVQQVKCDVHLTFLDAYTPYFWQESELGDVNTASDVNCWADHYYTRDYTLAWTQQNLTHAHNVDVTDIDQMLKDHKFPWKWYYATISDHFPKSVFLKDSKLTWAANGTEYGFARSKEAADPNSWEESLKLPISNSAVKIKSSIYHD